MGWASSQKTRPLMCCYIIVTVFFPLPLFLPNMDGCKKDPPRVRRRSDFAAGVGVGGSRMSVFIYVVDV